MAEQKTIKIGMVGNGGVGKTCIAIQFWKGTFSEEYIPTIQDAFNKSIKIDGKEVQIEIIDTAGQEDFREMTSRYYQEFDGIILVYSIIDRDSNPLNDLHALYNEVKSAKGGTDVKCVIAANKKDLIDPNNKDPSIQSTIDQLQSTFNCRVFQTSAKTGENVTEIVEDITRKLISNHRDEGGNCCEIQ